MKTLHFLQVSSEIIGKHRYKPQGLIECKAEAGLISPSIFRLREADPASTILENEDRALSRSHKK